MTLLNSKPTPVWGTRTGLCAWCNKKATTEYLRPDYHGKKGDADAYQVCAWCLKEGVGRE